MTSLSWACSRASGPGRTTTPSATRARRCAVGTCSWSKVRTSQPAGEGAQRLEVVLGADRGAGYDERGAVLRVAGQHLEGDAEADRRRRHHPGELATAHDAHHREPHGGHPNEPPEVDRPGRRFAPPSRSTPGTSPGDDARGARRVAPRLSDGGAGLIAPLAAPAAATCDGAGPRGHPRQLAEAAGSATRPCGPGPAAGSGVTLGPRVVRPAQRRAHRRQRAWAGVLHAGPDAVLARVVGGRGRRAAWAICRVDGPGRRAARA